TSQGVLFPGESPVLCNGSVYFVGHDAGSGDEVWKSNGTAAGTSLVKDINPGPGSSFTGGLIALGGALYFDADDGVHGYSLWKSDGTQAGTQLTKPGVYVAAPNTIGEANGMVFFAGVDDAHGSELWRSDGTEAGTALVKDINPLILTIASFPEWLTEVAGRVFFFAFNGNDRELWVSDGTAAGT